MANENKSNVAIPATVIDQVTNLLNQINTTLAPYITPLTNEERRAILKMSDKTEAFVDKTKGYLVSNPEFIPSFLNTGDFEIDYQNNTLMNPVLKTATQLANNLNDTVMVSGSEAYKGSLMYYNNVKQGDKNGVANARTIYEDLKKRFPGKSNGEVPPPLGD